MGERHDLPKIKPDEAPTLLNREAGEWGFVGGFLGTFAASVIKGGAAVKIAVDLAITGAAALYGGMQGKARQEREAAQGRVVKTPTYWNGGIWGGLFVSGLIQAPVTYYSQFKGFTEKKLFGRLAIISGVVTLGSIVAGSVLRKESMQRDFDKSIAIRDANHAKTNELLQAVAASQQAPTMPGADEVSYKNNVTPDEAAALLEKQAQAPAPEVTKPTHPTHHAEHHDASHAQHHEHHQHAGNHADKHQAATSHTEHAKKHEADAAMAMGA